MPPSSPFLQNDISKLNISIIDRLIPSVKRKSRSFLTICGKGYPHFCYDVLTTIPRKKSQMD